MKRFFACCLALLLLAGCLAGCAAGKSAAPAESSSAASMAEGSYDYLTNGKEDAGASSGIAGGGTSFSGYRPSDANLKLIYQANFQIDTKQFIEDYRRIGEAVQKANGYFSNEHLSGTEPKNYGDSGRIADVTLRIPAEKYQSFCDELAGIGTIRSSNQTVKDVSDQYFDVEARIDMLELRYEKLMEHMKNATAMEDIIKLEAEISEVLYELDSYKGTKRNLDALISYCTVDVSLCERVEPNQVATGKETLGERIVLAGQAALVGMKEFGENLLVFLVRILPTLILLGLIALLVVWIVKSARCRRKKNGKQQGNAPAQQPPYPAPPYGETPKKESPKEEK